MMKVLCPVCERVMQGQGRSEWPEFPFCSRRCKLIDLGRWLNGSYSLPAEPTEDDYSEKLDAP